MKTTAITIDLNDQATAKLEALVARMEAAAERMEKAAAPLTINYSGAPDPEFGDFVRKAIAASERRSGRV